jgi:hypothetical protein
MTGVDAVHSSGARRAAHPQHGSGSHQPRRMYQSGVAAAPLNGRGGTSLGVRCRLVSPYLAAEITQGRCQRARRQHRHAQQRVQGYWRRRNRPLLRGGVDHDCSPFSSRRRERSAHPRGTRRPVLAPRPGPNPTPGRCCSATTRAAGNGAHCDTGRHGCGTVRCRMAPDARWRCRGRARTRRRPGCGVLRRVGAVAAALGSGSGGAGPAGGLQPLPAV